MIPYLRKAERHDRQFLSLSFLGFFCFSVTFPLLVLSLTHKPLRMNSMTSLNLKREAFCLVWRYDLLFGEEKKGHTKRSLAMKIIARITSAF